MIDELNAAIETYWAKWRALAETRADKQFFEGLRPTAVGWKFEDRSAYDIWLRALHDQCDFVVETWMNGRWIAKLHLRDDVRLARGIEVIKLMERRPGSRDALGLDHLDFYGPSIEETERILRGEPNLKWSRENNSAVQRHDWLSVWFEGGEAKLKPDTVLDIVCFELQEINKNLGADAIRPHKERQ